MGETHACRRSGTQASRRKGHSRLPPMLTRYPLYTILLTYCWWGTKICISDFFAVLFIGVVSDTQPDTRRFLYDLLESPVLQAVEAFQPFTQLFVVQILANVKGRAYVYISALRGGNRRVQRQILWY